MATFFFKKTPSPAPEMVLQQGILYYFFSLHCTGQKNLNNGEISLTLGKFQDIPLPKGLSLKDSLT
jgi:hypothetical protein